MEGGHFVGIVLIVWIQLSYGWMETSVYGIVMFVLSMMVPVMQGAFINF